MFRHRALIVCLIASCGMLGGFGAATARGQVPSLPPAAGLADTTLPPTDILSSRPVAAYFPDHALGKAFDSQTLDMSVRPYPTPYSDDCWQWQVLPEGLMFPAYLASGRESRFSSHWVNEQDQRWLWDIALGTHVGMLRYGTWDPILPEGWQVDIEGAAFPRLSLNDARDLESVDFRFGIPITFRQGAVETKFGYYHLSSHMGDERMVRNASLARINYARDVMIAAVAVRPLKSLRLYAEAGWAFFVKGGSEPWEFQFGVDYSPVRPTGMLGAPFFAINTRIREEVDFGGNMTVQTGLQWRGETGKLFRAGFHYFNGKSDQYQFFREHEEQVGAGLWYDF
ncbi:MAG: DUF1207 domain-containing protein [Planctomycetota bacterium]